MKHLSPKSKEDPLGQEENSTEMLELLDYQIPRTYPEISLDEIDVEDLIAEAYYVMSKLVNLRMTAELRSDTIKIFRRLEESLTWYKIN